jgi:hypothetical protein
MQGSQKYASWLTYCRLHGLFEITIAKNGNTFSTPAGFIIKRAWLVDGGQVLMTSL